MCFYDMFTDGKAEPAAANFPAAGKIGSIKSFKYSSQVFFCNTGAVITDVYQYMFAIYIVKTGFYCAMLLTVFDGIVNQVYKYLPDLFFVGINR